MPDPYETLQQEYVAALRAVVPSVRQWWTDHCPYVWTEPIPESAMSDFHRRWPAGPAAHPRVLAVFRQFFFAAEELNDRTAAAEIDEDHEDVPVWGADVPSPSRSRVLPIDLLVNDLESVAPDLFEVMQGLVFVPIGMDPDGEVC